MRFKENRELCDRKLGYTSVARSRLYLTAAIVVEVSSTLTLKVATNRPFLYIMVLAGFVAAFFIFSLVLREGMNLGVAYGVWGASGVAATALLAAQIYGEPLTAPTVLGLVLISVGVLTVALGPQRPSVNGG